MGKALKLLEVGLNQLATACAYEAALNPADHHDRYQLYVHAIANERCMPLLFGCLALDDDGPMVTSVLYALAEVLDPDALKLLDRLAPVVTRDGLMKRLSGRGRTRRIRNQAADALRRVERGELHG